MTVDQELVDELQGRVGSRGVSGFVTRAIRHEVERGELAESPGGATASSFSITARRGSRDGSSDATISTHAPLWTPPATAIRLGGAVVLTGDPDDLGALAAEHRNVAVQSPHVTTRWRRGQQTMFDVITRRAASATHRLDHQTDPLRS